MHCLLHSAHLCGLVQGLRKQDKSLRPRSDRGLETVIFLSKDHKHSLSCLISSSFLPSGDMKGFQSTVMFILRETG